MKRRGFPKTNKILVEEGKFPIRLPSRESSIVSLSLERDLVPGKLLSRLSSIKEPIDKGSSIERELSLGKFSSREPSVRQSTMEREQTSEKSPSRLSSREASVKASTIKRESTAEPSESSKNNSTVEILTKPSPLDSSAKYRKYTNMVMKAAKEEKVFQVMYFFDVGKIKEELRKRGKIYDLARVQYF